MAKEDSSSFQDILLELMVANEALDKIEVGITALTPLLQQANNLPSETAIAAASLQKTNNDASDSPALKCCQEILEYCKNSYQALTLIAEETIYSGGTLIEIRNALLKTLDLAELERIRNLEKDRESKSGGSRAALSGVKGGNKIDTSSSGGDSKLGTIAKTVGIAAASFAFIPALINSFVTALRKQVNAAFSGKMLEQTKAAFKNIGKNIRGFLNEVLATSKEIGGKFSEKVKGAFSKIYNALPESFKNIAKNLGFDKISTSISNFAQSIADKFDDIAKNPKIQKISTSISNFTRSIVAGLDDVARIAVEGATEIKGGIKGGLGILRTNLIKLGTDLADIGKIGVEGATEIKAGIVEGLTKLYTAVKESALGKFFTEIGESFGKIGTAFDDILKTFRVAGEGDSFFAKIIRSVTEMFDFIGSMGSKFGALGSAIGDLLGKLALPLTIILGIKDAITGWMETEGDWTDKLEGSMTELVNGLFGFFIDIPKSIMSWIAGALGFKEFEKELDKMSFKETILKGLKSLIEDFFKYIGVGSSVKSAELNPVKADKKRDPKVLENAASRIVSPQASENEKTRLTSMLVNDYGFTKKEVDEAVQTKSASRIVSPQSNLETANTTGAAMTAYQKETSDLTATTASSVVIAPTAGNASTVNNANVSNLTVNNSNLPDRTRSSMMPAPGF